MHSASPNQPAPRHRGSRGQGTPKPFVRGVANENDPRFPWHWAARFLAQHLVTKSEDRGASLIALYDGNTSGMREVDDAIRRVLIDVREGAR